MDGSLKGGGVGDRPVKYMGSFPTQWDHLNYGKHGEDEARPLQ
jgi:hypothetical protein